MSGRRRCASKPEVHWVRVARREGNIELNLISAEPTHGGAMLVLNKGHPLYMEVRRHIPNLRPRVWKCVNPWKDQAVFDVDTQSSAGKRQSALPTH